MNISIVGTGYVGLVTGTCLADMGHNVHCIDINKDKIENLNNGIIPIYEPGLEELITKNVQAQKLFFTTNYEVLEYADAVFSAVGTPPDEDGSADLQYVLAVAKESGSKDYDLYMKAILLMKQCMENMKSQFGDIAEKRLAVQKAEVEANPRVIDAVEACCK